MKPRLGITPKLTLIFVGFAALLLAGVASLAYINGQNALLQAAISELQSIATEKDSALTEWEQDKQTAVQTIASLSELQRALTAFHSAPADSREAQAAHDQLIDQLSPWAGDDKEFLGLLIMNPDTAEIIAATNVNEEGKFKETFPYFINGREGFFLQSAYYSPALQGVAMTVSVPVKAADGRLLGVLAGRLNLIQLNAIIQRRSGLHQTDDAFLISASNLFVTQPRFISNPAVLRRGIHTEAIKRCLLHEDGALAYQDYREGRVIGVYRWLPEFDMCLIVKLDQAEAFEPSRAFGQTLLILSLAVLAVASVLAIGLARTIVRPLQSLQSGVVRFGQGDLDARLPETSRDELGVLVHEFNQMATSLAQKDAQLREYATHLEQKVQERTAALQENEASFRLMFASNPLPMWVYDLQTLQFLEVNNVAVENYGYTRDEFLRLTIADIRPFEDQTRLQENVARDRPALQHSGQWRHRLKDGRVIDVEIISHTLQFSGKRAALVVAQDVTERQQAEGALKASEERFRLIVEAAPSAIIAVDGDGKINLVNIKAQELFGYGQEELLGHPVEMLVPERFRTRHPDYRQGFLAQPTSRSMGAGRDLFGLHRDGREVPIEIGLTPYESAESQFTLALIVDITERKRMEETRAQLSAIVESSDDAITGKTLDGIITSWNKGAEKVYGYTADEVVGRSISILIPQDLPDELPTILNRIRMGVSIKHYETARLRKDGQRINVSLTISPIRDSAGNIVGASTIARDITQSKQAEEKIAYQAYLLENVNDAVIGSDENSLIRFWNQGAERILGWKAKEVIGRSGREILRSEFIDTDRETVLKILAEQGRWRGESILYRKDGSQVIMEVNSITLRDANGLITGYVSVNRDITERKQAEEHLQANAARAVLVAELSQGFAELTDDYQRLLGLAARRIAELIGDYCAIRLVEADDVTLQLVVDRHLDASSQEFMHRLIGSIPQRMDEGITAQVFRSGKAVLLPFVSPDAFRAQVKSEFHSLLELLNIHSVLIAPLRAEGKIIGTITMSRDQTPQAYTEDDQIFLQDLADRAALAIASARLYAATQQLNAALEQRVAERTVELSEANALLQMLLDQMPDHIYFKDAQSRFIRNSKSQAKALGLNDPAEAIGKSDFDFFPHAQLSYEKEQEIMQSGKPVVDEEEQVVWPDGRETWVSTTKMPLLDQAGQIIGTFGISRDITERKRAEASLQKAKLELEAANRELEAFSYSVSHDLRAPLRSVDGFSQALLEDYGDLLPPEGRNFLERVRSSAQRMATLIDDLLNLSRVTRVPIKLVPVDLTRLAENIAAELRRIHPEHSVKFTIAPSLKVRGDPHLLQGVLENFFNNAWKFTSKEEKPEIEFRSKRENNETVYFVRDNGVGFDMAYANKLFGAFQRLHTMTEFPGTGIGLATVQRIIHRHGGRVWAEGVVGKGATFFFTVPPLESIQPRAETKEKDTLSKRMEEII